MTRWIRPLLSPAAAVLVLLACLGAREASAQYMVLHAVKNTADRSFVDLTWIGGWPDWEVLRTIDRTDLGNPANRITTASARSYTDSTATGSSLFYYGITSGPCVPVPGEDLPDDAFQDTDCDGLDGDVETGVFVAADGDDLAPGTMAAPKLTIQAGIAEALTHTPPFDVYVSTGTYTGPIAMADGVSLYGGYNRSVGWMRSAGYIATITGVANAVLAANITTQTTLDRIDLVCDDNPNPGGNAIGLLAVDAPGLRVLNADILADRGGNGRSGLDGNPGAPGAPGNKGEDGGDWPDQSEGRGGAGGTAPCGGPTGGGRGGDGGHNSSSDGAAGEYSAGGAPGGGGGRGATNGSDGAPGSGGAGGADGVAGPGGDGGGTVVGTDWIGNAGQPGQAGQAGSGGGGGGAGGGGGEWYEIPDVGGGGGGGGAGGCGGDGGIGGQAGGSSFAMLCVRSSIEIKNCVLASSDGGRGGDGGAGGPGGTGGPAGIGGSRWERAGAGAGGGLGGNGGRGGNGGGGSGGSSYGLYRSDSFPSITGVTFNHGLGGFGGGSTSFPGQNGTSGDVYP